VEASDPVRRIADAVLYEGYVLWPYRRSALKNQRRWTFGGVYPEAHSARRGGVDDPSTMRTQCLLEGGADATVDVRVRFLHVVERQVLADVSGGLEPVDELEVGGARHLSWDEAVEREAGAGPLRVGALSRRPRRVEIRVAAGNAREELFDRDVGAGEPRGAGRRAGAIERRWRALEGAVDFAAEELEPGLHRLTVRIANTSPWRGEDRGDALRQTFCSTHTVLRAQGGAFVSLTDPPAGRSAAAQACENEGTWPVLVGEDGERGTLLSSPIILPDHPEVAPESPGELFDGGEIDQLLILNILSLTDEEKREMRETDPRTREILDRTEALSEEELMRLHGAIREFGMVRGR
jgi:hypothetical protein